MRWLLVIILVLILVSLPSCVPSMRLGKVNLQNNLSLEIILYVCCGPCVTLKKLPAHIPLYSGPGTLSLSHMSEIPAMMGPLNKCQLIPCVGGGGLTHQTRRTNRVSEGLSGPTPNNWINPRHRRTLQHCNPFCPRDPMAFSYFVLTSHQTQRAKNNGS